MPRYLVANKRGISDIRGDVPTALEAVSSEPNVTVVGFSDPHMVTIDTSAELADRLRQKLAATHIVEPEIRRELE